MRKMNSKVQSNSHSRCRSVLRKTQRRYLLGIIAVIALFGMPSALAGPLLGSDYITAPLDDFVSYFKFTEQSKNAAQFGLTQHLFTGDGGELLLLLDVAPDGKVVHMRFALPRTLIDDPKQTLAGRDMVKSFVGAVMSGGDLLTLGPLNDEISVRGLDLHQVPIGPDQKFADTKNDVPKTAYKIGPGPLEKGERLTFIARMPSLTKTPSDMYQAFSGKAKQAGTVASTCRLAFFNDTVDKTAVLVADAWNEDFWQKNLEPKQGTPAAVNVDPKQALNHALELLATKDPLNARAAERELEAAERLKSTDFRIEALKAVAAIQVGRRVKGLNALRDAIAKLPAGAGDDEFRKQMLSTAEDTDTKLKHLAPPAVPVEKRHYTIPGGTPAVVADRDAATGAVTLAIPGGHDPDAGKQDGNDDGIIEVLWENVNKPDEILRAPKD